MSQFGGTRKDSSMKSWKVILAFVCTPFLLGAACNSVFGPKLPPDTYTALGAEGYLVACEPYPGAPNVTCCGYGIVSNSGELCFHVLCQLEPSEEFQYADTFCVPPPEPGKDA